MKKILILSAFLMFYANLQAQVYTQRDTTKYYSFQINYWFNMHHFLWLESFMNTKMDSTIVTQKFSKNDQKSFDLALAYYNQNLVEEDLRTSDYMTDFKVWITNQKSDLNEVPAQFTDHVSTLKNISKVYSEYFWPTQQSECKQILNDHIELIRKTEEEFVDRITKLTGQFWQFEKLNVDITYVAKATKWNSRNRPYTTIFPTHVVMNAVGENKTQGNWLELLYHESAHHLILGSSYYIGATIKDLTEVMKIKPPRQLGHAYLFYLTGHITKDLLSKNNIDYPLIYMQRNRVFKNYYPLLELHLKQYMNREITLAEATTRMIEGLK